METFFNWIISFLKSLGNEQPTRGIGAPPPMPPSTSGGGQFPIGRTMVSRVQSGLRKYDMARRAAALKEKYIGVHETIRQTRKTLKKIPRKERYMFAGYLRFLDEMETRVERLYSHLCTLHNSISRYDAAALNEEVARLEAFLRTNKDAPHRMEAEGSLEARRRLLETVTLFETKLDHSAAQLAHIAATLDLNHLRIVSIASRSISGGETGLLDDRMMELTEQLGLLEESLRELDTM